MGISPHLKTPNLIVLQIAIVKGFWTLGVIAQVPTTSVPQMQHYSLLLDPVFTLKR